MFLQQLKEMSQKHPGSVQAAQRKCMKNEYILKLLPQGAREPFFGLLQEYISHEVDIYHDADMNLTFVQSGYVYGGFIPELSDYDNDSSTICIDRYSVH